MRQALGHLLRFGIGGAGLIYAFWGVDLGTLATEMGRYDPFRIFGVLLFSALVFLYVGYRIARLALGKSSVTAGALGSVLCHGLNNLLPTKLGELAKAIYLSHHGTLSRAEALGVVFWERFLDLNAVLVVGLVPVALAGHPELLWPLAIALGAFWVLLLAFGRWKHLPGRLIGLLPFHRLRAFLLELYAQVNDRLAPAFLLESAWHTGVVWLLYVAQTLLVLFWVAQLPIEPAQALIVFVVSALGMAIPATPGGLGVFEAAVVASLGWFGVGKEEALSAAVTLHMIEFIPTVLLTLWLLARHETGLTGLLRGRAASVRNP
jgi:glycosyltransferase 2 family protein